MKRRRTFASLLAMLLDAGLSHAEAEQIASEMASK